MHMGMLVEWMYGMLGVWIDANLVDRYLSSGWVHAC